MNAINKALNEIKFNIPSEILQIAFQEYGEVNINKIISLDERIMNCVIRPRCLVDCNIVSGIDMTIDLYQCTLHMLNNFEHIIEVPKHLTGGKSILTPLELVANVINSTAYSSSVNYTGISPLANSATIMMNNLATHSIISSSKLELIGENTILVHDPSVWFINGYLRCRVEFDQNMSTLKPSGYIHFGKLCILATKAYIYKHLKIKLDQGYVYGGHELSSVTEIVESYSDANEQYYEFLNTTMRKTLYVTQSDNLNRFVKMQFGNNI